MATNKKIKKSSQYTLMKGALLDVSAYVYAGMEIEEIEEDIKNILIKERGGFAKPVPSFLAYHIQTNYEKDEDVINLMDKIVNNLDLELVKLNYEDIKDKIN